MRIPVSHLFKLAVLSLLVSCGGVHNPPASSQTINAVGGRRLVSSARHFLLTTLTGKTKTIALFGVYYSARTGAIISFTEDDKFVCHLEERYVSIPWADVQCIIMRRDISQKSNPIMGMTVTTRAGASYEIPLSSPKYGGLEVLSQDGTKTIMLRYDGIESICQGNGG